MFFDPWVGKKGKLDMERESADMTYVEHVELVEASAREVWRFIDWPNLDLMRPGGFFLQIDYQERQPVIGATRRVLLSNGSSINERLEAYDSQAHHLAYRILDSGDMPVADYVGEVRISGCGESACYMKFSSRCSPVGLSDGEWSQTYKAMQAASVDFIKSQLISETVA